MSVFLKLVGNKVRELRKHAGLTQEELSEKTGLQNSYIGGIERGERNISLLTLEKISEGLNTNAYVLLDFKNMNLNELDHDKNQTLDIFIKLLQQRSYEDIKFLLEICTNISMYLQSKDKS